MTCEAARQEFADALNAWTRMERESHPLLLSCIGTEGSPGEPMAAGSEMFERVRRLMEEREKAFERHGAADADFRRVTGRHRDD